MTDLTVRAGVLALVSLGLWLAVRGGRHLVEVRRREALAGDALGSESTWNAATVAGGQALVRILAFSSDDCAQCHRLQAPVLRRVVDALGDAIAVVEVDAPHAPELARRYNVLTVPTTVVLDSAGHAHAINYGFANTQRLRAQVDAVLAARET